MNDRPVAAESTAGDRRQHRLGIRVITMSTRSVQRSRFRRRRTEPPTGTARRHWAEGLYAAVHPYSSTFLRPFAPGPLQALRRSYGRSDSCSPGSSAFLRHELRLSGEQVSLIHAPDLPTIPSPTTCGCCVSSGHATHRRIAPRFHPTTGSSPNGNSGLRLQLAGSPHLTGRIEFLIVRTGRSPPAAPHPVSPRRSCRLITSYVSSVRTSTSLIVCALRRTSRGNAPGTVTRKPTDPGRAVQPRIHTGSLERGIYSTLSGSDSCPARFRGRCPRLLYESPAGISGEKRARTRLLGPRFLLESERKAADLGEPVWATRSSILSRLTPHPAHAPRESAVAGHPPPSGEGWQSTGSVINSQILKQKQP